MYTITVLYYSTYDVYYSYYSSYVSSTYQIEK